MADSSQWMTDEEGEAAMREAEAQAVGGPWVVPPASSSPWPRAVAVAAASPPPLWSAASMAAASSGSVAVATGGSALSRAFAPSCITCSAPRALQPAPVDVEIADGSQHQGRKRRRLRAKQPCCAFDPPAGAGDGLDLLAEKADAKKCVYLITIPHTTRADLDQPDRFSRQQIIDKVLDACRKPVEYNGLGKPVDVLKMVVAREPHSSSSSAAGRFHYHVALLAKETFRFNKVKKALQANHRLASHWSCSHDGYHSAVKYLVVPSPDKMTSDLDQGAIGWAKDGQHPPLLDAASEPNTADALRARRERKVKERAEAGKSEAKASEMDVYPIIVQQGFRNTPDDCHAHRRLIDYLQKYGSPQIHAWAFRNRHKLSGLIDDVWSWEDVGKTLEAGARLVPGGMEFACQPKAPKNPSISSQVVVRTAGVAV